MDLVSHNGYAAAGPTGRLCDRLKLGTQNGLSPEFFCFERSKIKTVLTWQLKKQKRGVSVQPRSRRPGRTGAARGTHARTSTCTPRIPCQAPASFHLSSREAEKDFVQPRCIRLISGHEMPANKSCSPRVIVVALRSRDALCLRCACACHASLAAQTHACRPACSA